MENPTTTSQPPPDLPMPPPGREAVRSRIKMGLILGVGLFCMMPSAIMVTRQFMKEGKAAACTEAFNNLRAISVSFIDFDSEYGAFPSAATAPEVKSTTGTPLTLGSSSSNQIFRQLIAHGLKSEKPFWAANASAKKPDDLFHDDVHALAPGECGYAYIAGVSSSSPGDAPLVVSPLIRGSTSFDRTVFGGKAVVLTANGLTRLFNIHPSGKVIIGGKDIFDPSQPFWGGKAPDIKWQE